MRNLSHSTFALWLTLGLVPLAAAAFATGCSAGDDDGATASADALGACGQGSTDDADDDADDDGSGGKGATRAKCGKARRDAGTTTKDSGTTTSDAGTTTKDSGTTTADAGSPPPPPPPAPTTCTSFTYSAWGACQPNGTQTRTVTSSSPAGCTGGTPVLSQSCTYIDGAALYTQYCAGCHGNSKKGSSATSIQSAIDKNIGGMGSLKFLTAAQVQAISTAP